MSILRKLFPPKHKHTYIRGRVQSMHCAMTLGAGIMTYVTHRCSECGEFYQVKYRGHFRPEDFD